MMQPAYTTVHCSQPTRLRKRVYRHQQKQKTKYEPPISKASQTHLGTNKIEPDVWSRRPSCKTLNSARKDKTVRRIKALPDGKTRYTQSHTIRNENNQYVALKNRTVRRLKHYRQHWQPYIHTRPLGLKQQSCKFSGRRENRAKKIHEVWYKWTNFAMTCRN